MNMQLNIAFLGAHAKPFLCLLLFAITSMLGLTACDNTSRAPIDVTSLQVTPATTSLPIGVEQPFVAQAVMSDNTVMDVTASPNIQWSSSDDTIAQVDGRGQVIGLQSGTVTITAAYPAVGSMQMATAQLTITNAVATALQITSSSDVMAVGMEQHLVATVLYSDGKGITVTDQVHWSSNNAEVAVISDELGTKGVILGIQPGDVKITAIFDMVNRSTLHANAELRITDAVATTLQVTPASTVIVNGLTQQFEARLSFSDGNSQSVTSSPDLTWYADDSMVAVVSNDEGSKGIATANTVGNTLITARFENSHTSLQQHAELEVTSAELTSIEIEVAQPTMPAGRQQQLTAWGILSNGERTDLTQDDAVSWSSDNTGVATISSIQNDKGLVTAVAYGDTTITVTMNNGINIRHSATLMLSVTNAEIVSLTVSPELEALPVGMEQQFIVTAEYSDGAFADVTEQDAISWGSDDIDIATVSNTKESKGLAKAMKPGPATITATWLIAGESPISASAALEVTTAVVTAIQIRADITSVPVGLTQQFTAWAIFSDETEEDVTDSNKLNWNSSTPGIATVTQAGLVKAIKQGNTIVNASLLTNTNTVSDSANVSVIASSVVGIAFSPPKEIVRLGSTTEIRVFATWSDGQKINVTGYDNVTWSSSDQAILKTLGKGMIQGLSEGSVTLTATYYDTEISANIQVIADPLAVDFHNDCDTATFLKDSKERMWSCPLTTTAANRLGMYVDAVTNDFSLFHGYRAGNICAVLGGRKPTDSELSQLFTEFGDVNITQGWQTDSFYWLEWQNNSSAAKKYGGGVSSGLNKPHALTCIIDTLTF